MKLCSVGFKRTLNSKGHENVSVHIVILYMDIHYQETDEYVFCEGSVFLDIYIGQQMLNCAASACWEKYKTEALAGLAESHVHDASKS